MTTARERDLQRKLINEIKRTPMQAWIPQDVEAETVAGYYAPTTPPMADWQIARLTAWNRAIVLGGKHYEEWRAVFIAPIEQGWRSGSQYPRTRLARHHIARSIEYEARMRQDTLKMVAQMTPEQRVKYGFDDPTRYPVSHTPACDQSPPTETAPRSR